MTAFLTRKRLIRRGLASAKLRRRLTRSEWVEAFLHGRAVRWMVLAGAGLALSRMAGGGMERLVMFWLIFALACVLLWMNHPKVWADNSRLFLILGSLVGHLEVVRCVMNCAADSGAMELGWDSVERHHFWELAVPYALGPLLISVLLGGRLAVVLAIFASLFGSMLGGGVDARFLVLSLLSGFVAALMTRDVRRRSDLLRAGLCVGATSLILAFLLGHVAPPDFHNLAATHWDVIGWKCAAAFGSGVASSLLISAALPVVEGLFRITTPITWLELSDLNHPLLKRMTLEAPGTYHHSLMVAQLSEAAAEAVGANAGMVRVCSYFHDIGKLVKPEYFIENARFGRNAHEDLAPTMSALVIIAHVKEGVDLALKHRLNREIIDVIQQHHGNSLVYYFYSRALEQRQRALEETQAEHRADIPEVSESSFRYHGPKPQTRECAIISLADTIESSSRCLEKVTPQKIDQLVDEVMQRRLIEGQMQECDLRMTEYEMLAESFKRTLRSMLHSRIAYPKSAEKTVSLSVATRQERGAG